MMNAKRIVLREDDNVFSVPYSSVVFGKGMLYLMKNFHLLPPSLKFDCIFDHEEVHYQCEQICPKAYNYKFSVRFMNTFLMFTQLFDLDFFCNAIEGIKFLIENQRVNGWYQKPQLAHDLLRNERGQCRFYRNWKFNSFVMTDFQAYERFRSFLKLCADPLEHSDNEDGPVEREESDEEDQMQ